MIYVASSWRNDKQPGVVAMLRQIGYEVYDFRNPKEGDKGFAWSEIDPNWKSWTKDQYKDALKHPTAERGFKFDMDALKACDICVLVMPCGRSAHLEAGYAVGARKRLIILLDDGEPELMYKMAEVVTSLDELAAVLNFKEHNQGTHYYPGCASSDDFYTSDCKHGCGCWMGSTRSGGPDGVDPFGECPENKRELSV